MPQKEEKVYRIGWEAPASVLNLRNREEVVSLLLAMTKVEMGANTAQILSMRSYAELGFDMAVTAPGFYNGIE